MELGIIKTRPIIITIVAIIIFLVSVELIPIHATVRHHTFTIQDSAYTRLCNEKSILTVNGQFPGPTVTVTEGDTIAIVVINSARENITIHWHGVKQLRYPWSDGPEYITQCPIQPGARFKQRIVLSDEIGTLWWHAHSDWSRATVHGALVVRPRPGRRSAYPFPLPHAEIPIILGEWWNSDLMDVMNEFLSNGGDPNISDAFLINGQPGDLYPCSTQDTFRIKIDQGKKYLIRMVNGVMNTIMFFRIANHNLTVVATDGAYTKPLTTNYLSISPGETMDILFEANQPPSHYYMAATAYAAAGTFDNTTTTAIIQYTGNYTPPTTPLLPTLPAFNDTLASANFTAQLRSLASSQHPIDVPQNATTVLFFTLSINTQPCANDSCDGPFGERLLASINNITFRPPRTAILLAYYQMINGVYANNFPSQPPLAYNYTMDLVPRELWTPQNGTRVRILNYNTTVELVFQGTNAVAGIDHPMHLHGHSFYVVGSGFGNFDRNRDPQNYNLVDPPLKNTIAVPRNGWAAIRFRANNPGVWLMHCHFERHISWGMEMVFITRNGRGPDQRMSPPPRDFPRC